MLILKRRQRLRFQLAELLLLLRQVKLQRPKLLIALRRRRHSLELLELLLLLVALMLERAQLLRRRTGCLRQGGVWQHHGKEGEESFHQEDVAMAAGDR